MASSFTTTGAAPAAAQTISAVPLPHQQQQQHHFHHEQHQQQQEQHHQFLQQQQQQEHDLQQQAFAQAGPSDPGTTGRNNGNGSTLNLGLGFLRGLGLERKTNRDGQTPKRRGPKPDSKPALTRRQELNRQAQRTHRQRKEVYIKSLEDQVMQLKELYAAQAQERGVIDEENRKLKELLQFHGIQVPGDLLQRGGHQQLSSDGGFPTSFSASDGGFGQGSDYATPSSYQASGSETGGPADPSSALSAASDGTLHQSQQQQQQQQQQQLHLQQQQQPHSPATNLMLQDQLLQGNAEENQLGIDFVLALEAFCNDHQQYLCVRSSQSIESAEPVASGHAMMLSCPPASHIESTPAEPYPHRAPALPTASLDSLLRSARQLPLVGDGELTPVMALNLIQTDKRFPTMTVKEFVAVQKELEEKTRCYGFGAVLEEFEVRDALENLFSGRVLPA